MEAQRRAHSAIMRSKRFQEAEARRTAAEAFERMVDEILEAAKRGERSLTLQYPAQVSKWIRVGV